jgi:hypothetical protein
LKENLLTYHRNKQKFSCHDSATGISNGRISTVYRALDGSTYPG